MFIPNVVHAFVDFLCKWVGWKLNVEVLFFIMISSVIDRIEASWHWFCMWFPWKAIHVRVLVTFSVLWQEEFMWMSRIGIAEYFKDLSSIDIFKNIFIKNIPPK